TTPSKSVPSKNQPWWLLPVTKVSTDHSHQDCKMTTSSSNHESLKILVDSPARDKQCPSKGKQGRKKGKEGKEEVLYSGGIHGILMSIVPKYSKSIQKN